MQALQQAVGGLAGTYLYPKQGSDGKWYVEIYTNGPDGKGPKFKDLNEVAGEFDAIIVHSTIVAIDFVDSGTTVEDDYRHKFTLSRTNDGGGSAAVTGFFKGVLTIKLLDPTKDDLDRPGELR